MESGFYGIKSIRAALMINRGEEEHDFFGVAKGSKSFSVLKVGS